jgi:hypothetical protein
MADRFGSDPTDDWPEQRQCELVLDLRDMSLNGIPLGAPPERMDEFGRPSNRRPFKHGTFLYDLNGVVIETGDERTIDYFGLPFVRRPHDEVGPCEVEIICPDGSRLAGRAGLKVDEILAKLPTPDSNETDESETLHELTLEGAKIELESSHDGELRRLNLMQL